MVKHSPHFHLCDGGGDRLLLLATDLHGWCSSKANRLFNEVINRLVKEATLLVVNHTLFTTGAVGTSFAATNMAFNECTGRAQWWWESIAWLFPQGGAQLKQHQPMVQVLLQRMESFLLATSLQSTILPVILFHGTFTPISDQTSIYLETPNSLRRHPNLLTLVPTSIHAITSVATSETCMCISMSMWLMPKSGATVSKTLCNALSIPVPMASKCRRFEAHTAVLT